MEKWQRKIALIRLFSALPAGDRLLDLFRYHFGGLRKYNPDTRWNSIAEMLRIVRAANIPIAGKDLAEIGSGWHPLLAPMFYGMGVGSIRMTDISPHAKTEFVQLTVNYLLKHAAEIADLSGVPAATLEKRWREILPNDRNWEEVFRDHGISFSALDFTQTGWPDRCVDLIFSNSCISCIPEPILRGIFVESNRVLRKGGFFAHNTDPVDALTNGSINFLRYSREEWERIGTCRLHYQNRLRPGRYLEIARAAGFEIVYDKPLLYPNPPKLDRAQLHPDFRDLPESELLCTHFLFAGRRS
jgi:Methyltransferase domain